MWLAPLIPRKKRQADPCELPNLVNGHRPIRPLNKLRNDTQHFLWPPCIYAACRWAWHLWYWRRQHSFSGLSYLQTLPSFCRIRVNCTASQWVSQSRHHSSLIVVPPVWHCFLLCLPSIWTIFCDVPIPIYDTSLTILFMDPEITLQLLAMYASLLV